ncbi:MAG TPA: hypothetical protein DCP31_33590 [Cyanobacteria bacterium UBA8543]|nr:hypothetical protein [Cyanobacteria bacterium UBA8543]
MFSQLVQRFSKASLGALLLLLVVSRIFVYQVSPLRNPTFKPMSANAGSLVWWLQGVGEGHWIMGASILAFLFATNLTLICWQWYQSLTINLPRQNAWLISFLLCIATWVLIFRGLWLAFVHYLLDQWLID